MRILIVDDEPNIRHTLRLALEAMGHEVVDASTPEKAIEIARAQPFDTAIVDVRLGNQSGIDLIAPLVAEHPRIAPIVITAHSSVDIAVEAMRKGAFDYLAKPFTPAQIRGVLERVAREKGLRVRVSDLEQRVRDEVPEVDFNSTDPAFKHLMDQARRVAPTDAALLIRGENGTGKTVLARSIHEMSKRTAGPFVTVSCPSLSADLLESDLFGHVRGAFTSAIRDAQGKVAAAEGGTLFLDEIGELPIALQPKLLRFLQDRRYERVGESITRSADVRLIAATNRNLEAAVAQGSFREDLLYRINVIELVVPPLRSRTDLADVANRLLAFFARQTGRTLDGFTHEALQAMSRYPWPGNLRELRNAIERAAILAPGPEIGQADLPERISLAPSTGSETIQVGQPITLETLEAHHIAHILAHSAHLDEAAATLGIDPSTLYRKRKRYGL